MKQSFDAMLDFARACVKEGMQVVLTTAEQIVTVQSQPPKYFAFRRCGVSPNKSSKIALKMQVFYEILLGSEQ